MLLRLDSHSIVSTVKHILKQCHLDHTTSPTLIEKLEDISPRHEIVVHDWEQLLSRTNSSHRREEGLGEWMDRATPIAQERLAVSWPLKKRNITLASTLCSKCRLKTLDLANEWTAATKYGYLRMLEKLVDIDNEVAAALAGCSVSIGFTRGLNPERRLYLHCEDTPLQWSQVQHMHVLCGNGMWVMHTSFLSCRTVCQVVQAGVKPTR